MEYEIQDRYSALWIPTPDIETICFECDWTGFIPLHISDPDINTIYKKEWEEREKENPPIEWWHYIICPKCKGTRKK